MTHDFEPSRLATIKKMSNKKTSAVMEETEPTYIPRQKVKNVQPLWKNLAVSLQVEYSDQISQEFDSPVDNPKNPKQVFKQILVSKCS